MRLTRFSPVLLVAVLLAGCGDGVDRAKSMSDLRTIPATAPFDGADPGGKDTGGTETGSAPGAPKSGDDAFSADSLRLVDPCSVMDDNTLSAFGKPAENRLRDYSSCSNYMKTPEGKDLNFSLTIGEITNTSSRDAKLTLAGLPAIQSELDDKTACFITALTEQSPARGISLQIGGEAGTLCEPGRKLLEAIVNSIRAGAKPLTLPKSTLVALNPCETFAPDMVKTALGKEADPRLSTFHSCNWNGDGTSLSASFKLGYKPEDLQDAAKTKEVDLGGGIKGYQEERSSSSKGCRLQWTHAPYAGDKELGEVIDLDLTFYSNPPADPCGQLHTAAKALAPKLPTA